MIGASIQSFDTAHECDMPCVAVAWQRTLYDLSAVDLVAQQPYELPVVSFKQLFTFGGGDSVSGAKVLRRHASRNSAYSVLLQDKSVAWQARAVFCTNMFILVEIVPL